MKMNTILKFRGKDDVHMDEFSKFIEGVKVDNIMIIYQDENDKTIHVKYEGKNRLEILGMLSALQIEVWGND